MTRKMTSTVMVLGLLLGQMVLAEGEASNEPLSLRIVIPVTEVRPGTKILPIEAFLSNVSMNNIYINEDWWFDTFDYEAIYYLYDKMAVPEMGQSRSEDRYGAQKNKE